MDFNHSSPNISANIVSWLYDKSPPLEALSLTMQFFVISLYSVTAFLAFAGNITVITVLICGRSFSKELKVFLVNLALSDIIMAVFSIPFTYTHFMLGRWIFSPVFCPIVMFMQHVSVIVSVYTLTAVGIDRYYAVMYPLSRRVTKSRGPFITVVIWLVAVTLSSVQLIHGRSEAFDYDGAIYYDCKEVWDETEGKIYTLVIFFLTFLLPMLILMFTYSALGWRLFRHTTPGNKDESRDSQQLTAKLKIVKMLATVVFLFAMCWLPIHMFNFLIYFFPNFMAADNDEDYHVFIAAFFCCHWLSMANSFANPIIYCFMSDNFRIELKQLGFKIMRKHRPSCRSNSTRTTATVQFSNSLRQNNVFCMKPQGSSLIQNAQAHPDHSEVKYSMAQQ